MVGTCGIYVEGNAEIAATADFISIHLLILGADSNHDVYIFAGAIGLGAPAHLGVDESPIVIAHCRNGQHYTRTRILHRQWCAPKKAKRARIEELRRQNENEANLMESARAAVITHARSLAEQARISLRKEEELNLPFVATDEPTPTAPLVAPSTADILSAFSTPILESTIDALSPEPAVPIVQPSNAVLLPPPPPLAPILNFSTAAHSPAPSALHDWCAPSHPRHKKKEKANVIAVGPIVLPMAAAVSAPPLHPFLRLLLLGSHLNTRHQFCGAHN